MSFESAFKTPHTPVESETLPQRTEFGFEDHTAEHIDLLLDSSKNLYEYGLALEDAARSEHKRDESASGLLDRMNEAVIELERFRDAAPLSEDEYHKMVDVYNSLKDDVRGVEDVYREFVDEEDEEPAAEADIESAQAEEIHAEEPPAPEAEEQPVEDVVEEKSEKQPVSEEVSIDTEAAEHLQERADDLIEEVTWTRDRLYSLFPKQERTYEVRTLLKELDVSQSRAEKLKRDLVGSDDAQYFERMQEEVRDNIATVDDGLQKMKDALDSSKQEIADDEAEAPNESRWESHMKAEAVEEAKATKEGADGSEQDSPSVEVRAVEEKMTVAADEELASEEVEVDEVKGAESPITEADPEPKVVISQQEGNPEDASFVPDESEVARLMKQVNESQFYTDEERGTAQAMYEAYHRSVAEEKPANILRRNYENLHRFVSDLAEHPSAKYVTERADRILERIKAGAPSSDADMLETAQAMHTMVERIASNDSKDENDLLLAYGNLERFALENESSWVTVAGMHPPKAGPDGVIGALSLRKGLMLVRDKHKEFQRHPRKRLLLDKMVRMLGYVPKEGLPEDDIEEIIRLMKQVDVPNSVVGNSAKAEDVEVGKEREAEERLGPLKMRTIGGVPVPISGNAKPEFVRAARKGLIELSDTWKGDESKVEARKEIEKMIRVLRFAAKDTLTAEQLQEISDAADRLDEAGSRKADGGADGEQLSRKSGKLDIATEESEKEEGNLTFTIKTNDGENGFVKAAEEDDVAAPDKNASRTPETEDVAAQPITEIPQAENAAALADIEDEDPVNKAVPVERPTVRSWKERRAENTVVPMENLKESYPDFFAQVDVSELDRVIRSEVATHERKFIDSIDSWVGVKRDSAFGHIKDMTLKELDELVDEYGAGEREQFLEDKNVVYDSFISWYDQISEMSKLVETSDEMKFGDLFARFIIEQEIR